MMQSSPAVREAGAVTIRSINGKTEVLLIFSKKQPRVRIFPKGHIEAGESSLEAARRELLEEAGVGGEFLRELGPVSYDFRGKNYHVEYFLFKFKSLVHGGEDGREPAWFSPQDAFDLLAFDGLRDILMRAITDTR